MMEADRKLYADEVQNVVRKQKAQIEKLKRENSQLKGELQLQQRARPMTAEQRAAIEADIMQETSRIATTLQEWLHPLRTRTAASLAC